jgi:protein-tyrosine phosphatase
LIIDIHNHTLYGVDDGSSSLDESVKMLQDAKNQGIEAIILTPHYRRGMFPYRNELIEDHFENLQLEAAKIGITIYLGCEYHIDDMAADHFDNGRCHTMADGDYVLTEYSYETPYSYIEQHTYNLLSTGYIPIIAHAERYKCLSSTSAHIDKLSQMGALIQINADSVLGLTGLKDKHLCKKLLKNNQVDIIASDTHGITQRANHMRQAYDYVANKYGTGYANKIFYDNPIKIIQR